MLKASIDKPQTFEQYLSAFPEDVKIKLQEIRNTILQAASNATEGISYGMPAYKLNGKILVYFAGYKNHIGFYATPTGHFAFQSDLSRYKQGKGSVQFPIEDPMPLELIKRMVEFKVEQSRQKMQQIK